MLDESKSLRQEQGINIWRNNNCKGTLNYVMRFGKTRIIELVVHRTIAKHPDKKVIIVVPTEIAMRNVKYICDRFGIDCYTGNSLSKHLEKNGALDCYLCIVDEIHKFTSDKGIKQISDIKSDYKLGLTGSKLSREDASKLKDIGYPIIDTITEQEAIDNNWLSDYSEYNVAIQISDKDKAQYKLLSDAITAISDNFKGIYKRVNAALKAKRFDNDFDFIQSLYIGKKVLDSNFRQIEYIQPDTLRRITCHLQGYRKDAEITNDYVNRIQTFWNPNNIEELAKTYIKCVGNRNAYLKHNVDKVNAVFRLSEIINKPTIVYNESIEMIEQIYDTINVPKVKYHSQMEGIYKYYDNGEIITYLSGEKAGQPKLFGKTVIKKDAIDAIREGKALYLITGKSLNESLNLPNVECIICTAGDTNPTTYDQRVARGKTIDSNNSNKQAIIINLFIDDFYLNDTFVSSKDKQKLSIRQENVKNAIWMDNIDDFVCVYNNNILLLQHE